MEAYRTHPNEKLLYTARTHTIGGREQGHAQSSDGQLDVRLSIPGSSRPGTNPEQLLAAGWSACFEGALGRAARAHGVKLETGPEIDAEIDLNQADDGLFLRARLSVTLPGVDRAVAETLIAEAEQTCPYSKALRGNVDVAITLI
ncbi:organic hydroperoxide resistance protein [Sphingomonas sp. JC676]|uniref:organic hydroperoxide resistance protein n=1 Tax=Sphingomonas sp. JC676 TaxID=2768065 RepID=UPI0016583A84|nr:organic hydroperoxide resistance protein [Sphingomonas sp. JC676]MBC9032159.1 organic hydroperoxide resistance protein [Sphingomonas sp. JC676]